MKIRWFGWLALALAFALLVFPSTLVSAQEGEKRPKITLQVFLQQASLRVNDQAQVTVHLSNPTAYAVDSARLEIFAPAFVRLHRGDCSAPLQTGPLDLGTVPANSVKTEVFCLDLDTRSARSGSFNLLFSLVYSWGEKTDLAAVEKEVAVDLIGSETILGIPLAFAGFILPGLMLLIVLRWFKLPWAAGLSSEDRLIYSVLISVIPLGMVSWLSGRVRLPGLVQFFNFGQQVTIAHLVGYVLLGAAVGLLIGLVYRLSRFLRKRTLDALVSAPPSIPQAIHTALRLNGNYKGGPVLFSNKKTAAQVKGAHCVETDERYYVFSQFRLNYDNLSADDKKFIDSLPGVRNDFGMKKGLIRKVVERVNNPAPNVYEVLEAVNCADAPGNDRVVRLDKEDYEYFSWEKDSSTVLLDLQFPPTP